MFSVRASERPFVVLAPKAKAVPQPLAVAIGPPVREGPCIPEDAHLGVYPLLKRCLDVVVAAVALVALLPLLLVVALLIYLHDRGPILYFQTRVGRGGRPFSFPKFRSMRVDADRIQQSLWERNEQKDGMIFKMKRDPRVTPLGRFLRKYSIDEMPQLWCVLKGEMSLVGPRPLPTYEVQKHSKLALRRLEVPPGLTCIWQVSGRSDLDFDEMVRLDLEYACRRSLKLDLVLLTRTVPAVLTGRGAY